MVVIDVLNDAGGRELLFNKYGLRKVPVLAKGDQYAIGQMLEPFAKLAGISLDGAEKLSPEQLYRKYEMVFAAGQRYARQFPRVFERVTWHSAQHCRQMVAVLERMGIQPDGPLTASDLAGLPLPERLWE